MASGWHRESRRHALASKGIKTAVAPTNRAMEMQRFSGSNDDYAAIDDIRTELDPIADFLEVRMNDEKEEARVSLAFSFKDFQKFHPEVKKKDLIKLFDRLDEKRRATYFAVTEMNNEGKGPNTIIKTELI